MNSWRGRDKPNVGSPVFFKRQELRGSYVSVNFISAFFFSVP